MTFSLKKHLDNFEKRFEKDGKILANVAMIERGHFGKIEDWVAD